MKKVEPNVTLTNSTEREYMQYLEESAWRMDTRISELERLNQKLTEEITRLTAENRRLIDRISVLEYKDTSPKSEKIN